MALLTCENLTLGYEGNAVVSGLNFTVHKGDYLCIVGENGSGKSTLIKAILGLHPPIAGSIEVGEGLKKTEIGYLPQQTAFQRDFPASVEEIVRSGCLSRMGLRPYYNKKEKGLAHDNMEKLGLLPYKNRCYRELSGGQMQRVLLARALCAARGLLLLDEPVAGLDPKATEQMYAVVERLVKEEGITVMMISHDIAAAVRYASHILHIGHTPLYFGTKDDYIHSDIYSTFAAGTGEINHA